MGYYNIVRPCVVGKLHYASVPSQPVLVDDEVAIPLVESGDLAAYLVVAAEDLKGSLLGEAIANTDGPVYIAPQLGVGFAEAFAAPDDKPAPRKRAPRKAAED